MILYRRSGEDSFVNKIRKQKNMPSFLNQRFFHEFSKPNFTTSDQAVSAEPVA
jgi:hypothetical protein